MKPETKAKNIALDQVRKAGGYATRIEDQYRVGFPDTIMVLPIGVVFAEFKVVSGNMFGATPRQAEELRRIAAAAPIRVHTLVIGYKDGVFYTSTEYVECDIRKLGHTASDSVLTSIERGITNV